MGLPYWIPRHCVTVQCDANDTVYRSFAQAFALDEEATGLVYQHDLLRDARLADSHDDGDLSVVVDWQRVWDRYTQV